METFSVGTDNITGRPCIVSTNGSRIIFISPEDGQDQVLAARAKAMFNQHNRREALKLGHARSYSGYSTPPHSHGSDHVDDRAQLLRTAHQAEQAAEQWDFYREKVRAALNPPDLVEIDTAPGIGAHVIEQHFGQCLPRNARPVDAALRESLMLALAYATVNMEAYLDVASAARAEHARRYSDENAALHEQAAAQMNYELGED